MRNRIKAGIIAFVMVFGIGAAASVTPALDRTAVGSDAASASFSWCTASAVVCFATNTDGNGSRWSSQLLPVGTCIGMPAGFNDAVDSLWNKYTTGQVTVYENNPCGGYLFTYGPGAFVTDVGWFWHDEISAVCLGPRGGAGRCP